MMELGKTQVLKVINKTDFGVYLGETQEEKVLLPKKQVPENIDVGDEIEVFVYKDSSDRLISTTNVPKIEIGMINVLKVKEVTKIGAFLDWGLEKDLLLPFKEQTAQINAGEEYLVALYIDKSDRLCATMKLYNYMKAAGIYSKDDAVEGIIYEIKKEIGAFVAVDNKFYGMIYKTEPLEGLKVGDKIMARVANVREDGKLNLSIRKKAYMQMNDDAIFILNKIKEMGGVLPYNDKVAPEKIKKDFNISKSAFKRGVGHLLKEGMIEIGEKSIKIK